MVISFWSYIQYIPVYPALQRHKYNELTGIQVPPLKQGFVEQLNVLVIFESTHEPKLQTLISKNKQTFKCIHKI
jgi:hypothetical protein